MISLWLTIVLLALAWLPLSGIYQPTHIFYSVPLWVSYVFIGLSILLVYFSKKSIKLTSSKKTLIFFVIITIIPVFVFSFPYSIFAILLFVSLLLYLINSYAKYPEKSVVLRKFGSSVFIVGLVLFFQTLMIPLFYLFSSRIHRFDLLGYIINIVLNALGSTSSISQGNLVINSNEKVYTLIASFDAFGLFVIINLLIAAYVFLFLFSGSKKYYLLFTLVIISYMFIRYIVVILLYLEIEQSNIFWRPDIYITSMLPLVAVFILLFKKIKINENIEIDLSSKLLIKKYILSFISLILFFIFGIIFWGFSDPGTEKSGRILIDEKHSNWEWTTEKFDTTWYGRKSTYNYYCFAEYLKCFYNVDQKFNELTEDLLKNYDILIIKTPTEQFSENEIAAIMKFVNLGGGLFLIGDHTNVFGITSNLNTIATKFGLKFRNDGEYDLDGALSIYQKPEILPHPVVQDMPKMMFATSCMLDIPFLAENAIIGYGIKSIALDYSERNFFPENANNNSKMEYGLFAQASGVSIGKGRVFLFTDSTIWSNFFMFMPGKPELLLGIMAWLNRENSFLNILRLLSIFISALFMMSFINITFFGKTKIEKSSVIKMFLINGFVIIPVFIFGITKFNQSAYPNKEPVKEYIKIYFEIEHSNYELPIINLVRQNDRSYQTFFMWTQRVDLFPLVKKSFKESLKGDLSVIINPTKEFDIEEITMVREYLMNGGKMLVLDDPRNSFFSVTNKLVSNFGLKLKTNNDVDDAIMVSSLCNDTNTFRSSFAGEIEGGNSIANASSLKKGKEDRKSIPILSYQKVGKGMLVVMSNSFTFSDRGMKTSSEIPDENTRKIYKLEYWLLRDILGFNESYLKK
jgi:hypothetical protein